MMLLIIIRMRLAARVPPPPHFVARRLWRLTSFCERQIVDRSFEVSVRLHIFLQRFLQFLAELGSSWQILGPSAICKFCGRRRFFALRFVLGGFGAN